VNVIVNTLEKALIHKAQSLRGITLGELATSCSQTPPTNSLKSKGWVGELLETALGATAGNRSVPDFEELGIELKTLPLTALLQPKESTFVCSTPMANLHDNDWETSSVFRKLNKVLWVPFEADPNIDISLRRLGNIFLWSPSKRELEILKRDWDEHMETIALGRIEEIDGRRGEYLQVRPKGYSSKDRTKTFDADGARLMSNPRGFYLRTRFTKIILEKQKP
jgi:DNA mismatch repair protein MutH